MTTEQSAGQQKKREIRLCFQLVCGTQQDQARPQLLLGCRNNTIQLTSPPDQLPVFRSPAHEAEDTCDCDEHSRVVSSLRHVCSSYIFSLEVSAPGSTTFL